MMSIDSDVTVFESHRPALIALAYRMLGDMGRAEDIAQETWLRWQGRNEHVDAPKAFLLTIVTRLSLNELDSARARHEESRGDRLPEPVDLHDAGLDRVEMLDRISMAFLVLLQRLTPAERAVLLLHDVFDMRHTEIAALLDKTDAACRQLLSRARERVTEERRVLEASREEHTQLFRAFLQASGSGEIVPMMNLLTEDAVLIIDTGPEGRQIGRIRNAGRPIVGARRIAAFLAAVRREDARKTDMMECTLNGQPAIVFLHDGRPSAALLLSVAGGRIRHIFVQADPSRLTHVGPLH